MGPDGSQKSDACYAEIHPAEPAICRKDPQKNSFNLPRSQRTHHTLIVLLPAQWRYRDKRLPLQNVGEAYRKRMVVPAPNHVLPKSSERVRVQGKAVD